MRVGETHPQEGGEASMLIQREADMVRGGCLRETETHRKRGAEIRVGARVETPGSSDGHQAPQAQEEG